MQDLIGIPSPQALWILAAQAGLTSMFLVIQIKSTFPCLVCRILQTLGVKKNDPGFWPEKKSAFSLMTRDDWSDWSSTAAGNWIESQIAYLVNCGYCINFHLTWMLGIVAFLATFDPWSILLAPLSFAFSAAILSRS